MVFSDDPETGLAGPREVLATWPNTDSLAEFGVGGRAGTCSLLRPDPQTGDTRNFSAEELREALANAFQNIVAPQDPADILRPASLG